MTNKKKRNKMATLLRKKFGMPFVLSHKCVRAYQAHYGEPPRSIQAILGIVYAAGYLKVVNTTVVLHDCSDDYFADDDDYIDNTLIDNKGNVYKTSSYWPGEYGLNWCTDEVKERLL